MKEIRIFVPMPSKLKAEDIASLTPKRQKILLSLLNEEKTLTRVLESIKEKIEIDPSTVFKTLKELEESGFVKRSPNKVYSLTRDGKLLCLMLAKPNGMNEEEIRKLLDKILREDFGIENKEGREDIIDSWRAISEIIS